MPGQTLLLPWGDCLVSLANYVVAVALRRTPERYLSCVIDLFPRLAADYSKRLKEWGLL